MSTWTNEQIDTFLQEIGMCPDGYDAMNKLGNYGLGLDEAAARLRDAGYTRYADWVLEQKKTGAYVRFNGTVLSTADFKVKDPFSGEEFVYSDVDSVKTKLVEIAQQMINHHGFTVSQSIANENGDETWFATDMAQTIVVS